MAAKTSLTAAEALHKGCMVREGLRFENDPEGYIASYGSNFGACNDTFVSWINCNAEAERRCAAQQSYRTTLDRCVAMMNQPSNAGVAGADQLNARRGGALGSATQLSEITSGAATDAIDSQTRSGAVDLEAGVSRLEGGDPNAAPASATNFGPGPGQIGATTTALSPEMQAILDVSVEALQRARVEGDVSVARTQAILDRGLAALDAERSEPPAVFNGSSEAQMLSRMRGFVDRANAADSQRQNSSPTASSRTSSYETECYPICVRSRMCRVWTNPYSGSDPRSFATSFCQTSCAYNTVSASDELAMLRRLKAQGCPY